ncbi:14453_t:CDS:2 [Funneliformis mosseae]|uniref:14453_t:CDS:1 n=1 Tax=Funneliformis mosseae TaxID=27381 RepID=A0A9N9H587_FUNMO|nr:14453_t:CDS:2 [Funneliformis mosseae]
MIAKCDDLKGAVKQTIMPMIKQTGAGSPICLRKDATYCKYNADATTSLLTAQHIQSLSQRGGISSGIGLRVTLPSLL